ncbi:hypothetical protein SDC9_116588 [bioreactor metagenome]|uniref:Uncharacterized protein n=1 Tax=bioreactor metagenome TaxID=1076179 RepID=A0A645BW17_9ZZZZ
MRQRRCVQLHQLVHLVLAQHLGHCAHVGRQAVPQHQLVAIVLQQQLVGAREGIGQGMAHGRSVWLTVGVTWKTVVGSAAYCGLKLGSCTVQSG